ISDAQGFSERLNFKKQMSAVSTEICFLKFSRSEKPCASEIGQKRKSPSTKVSLPHEGCTIEARICLKRCLNKIRFFHEFCTTEVGVLGESHPTEEHCLSKRLPHEVRNIHEFGGSK